MKNILAKLNNVINSLEEQGFVREANKLDELFNDMARKDLDPNEDENASFEDAKPSNFDPSMNVDKEFGGSWDKEFGGPDYRKQDMDVAPYALEQEPEQPFIKIKRVN